MNVNKWLFVFAIIGAIADAIAVLDYFSRKFSKRAEGESMPWSRKWRLILMLALLAISLGLSGYGFYRTLHPTVTEKVVEKPVDRIVERIVEKQVPVPCPHPPKPRRNTPAPQPAAPPPSGWISVPQCPPGASVQYLNGIEASYNGMGGIHIEGNVCVISNGKIYVHDNKGPGIDIRHDSTLPKQP